MHLRDSLANPARFVANRLAVSWNFVEAVASALILSTAVWPLLSCQLSATRAETFFSASWTSPVKVAESVSRRAVSRMGPNSIALSFSSSSPSGWSLWSPQQGSFMNRLPETGWCCQRL
ncbi:hypothetical protein KIPE111705_44230 [Kibdelosporangium persicum]